VHEQAAAAGAEIVGQEGERLESADEGWTVVTADGELRARAVIVATGARFRSLGVPGEELLSGHGVSTCATCDGPLLAGGVAAVVGGGDSALQEALTLAACVGRVVILQRGEGLDGQAAYRRRVAEQEGIEVRCRTVVEEIVGNETVRAVRVRDSAAVSVEELEVAGVFPFVGLCPNGEPFREHVAIDPDGALVTDEKLRTSAPGVFAAGIVRSGAVGRAAAAGGEGAAAAIEADAYLGATRASSVAPGGSSRAT
jgi:thioredoxin reductase (NADPH)